MPLPQVSDRIKELPGQALRAVFAGVGQLLLAADKVRSSWPRQRTSRRGRPPPPRPHPRRAQRRSPGGGRGRPAAVRRWCLLR